MNSLNEPTDLIMNILIYHFLGVNQPFKEKSEQSVIERPWKCQYQ